MSAKQPAEKVAPPYDYDEIDNGYPPLPDARDNLLMAVGEWGDGELADGFHTRDIAALLDGLDRVAALLDESRYDHSWECSAWEAQGDGTVRATRDDECECWRAALRDLLTPPDSQRGDS